MAKSLSVGLQETHEAQGLNALLAESLQEGGRGDDGDALAGDVVDVLRACRGPSWFDEGHNGYEHKQETALCCPHLLLREDPSDPPQGLLALLHAVNVLLGPLDRVDRRSGYH